MTEPICDHGPPPRWKPEEKIQWEGQHGRVRDRPRCPAFLLHKSKQCTQPGKRRFPYYCPNHELPVETYGDLCLRCVARRKSEALAYRNGQGQGSALARVVHSGELSNPDRLRELLGDDASWFDWLRAELKSGFAEIRAGDQAEGEERIAEALADFARLMTVCILDELAAEAAAQEV